MFEEIDAVLATIVQLRKMPAGTIRITATEHAIERYDAGVRSGELLRRDGNVKPVKVSELAKSLARRAWTTVRWREGTKVISSHASLTCAFGRLIETIGVANRGPRNGC